jgi:hypothetical protein
MGIILAAIDRIHQLFDHLWCKRSDRAPKENFFYISGQDLPKDSRLGG